MPNLIPDWLPWMRPAGRLIWSVGLFVIGLIVVLVLMRRPKPDRSATWAECIAGAVGVFGMMTLAYAIIPHEWITFSDKYLQWDTTVFVFRNNQKMLFFPWHWPFSLDKHRHPRHHRGAHLRHRVRAQRGSVRGLAEARAGEARRRRGQAEDLALRAPAAPSRRRAGDGRREANGGDA